MRLIIDRQHDRILPRVALSLLIEGTSYSWERKRGAQDARVLADLHRLVKVLNSVHLWPPWSRKDRCP